MPTIWDLSLATIIVVVALILRSYLPTYFNEKGKNLATREDVAQITNEIERVRTTYLRDIERLKAELEAANRQIQAELDKTVLVHRVQFESEFNALVEVWSKLATLRSRMGQLRPRMAIVDIREDRLQALQRRFEEFNHARGEFVTAVDDRSPFYAEGIFAELSELVLVGNREQSDVMLTGQDEPNVQWYDRGEAEFPGVVHSF